MSQAKQPASVKVEDGTVLTFRGVRWDAHWEFDCPVAIFSPAFYYAEDGGTVEGLVEDACIDACLDGELRTQPIEDQVGWRGWSLPYIRRKYYGKNIGRDKITARFFRDKYNDLQFEMNRVKP